MDRFSKNVLKELAQMHLQQSGRMINRIYEGYDKKWEYLPVKYRDDKDYQGGYAVDRKSVV